MSRGYKDLEVWRVAVDLCEQVYAVSSGWPVSEQFGLTTQARRAAVSVPSNIAEGRGRGSDNDFVRFLHISLGSLCELETQLLISHRLSLTAKADYVNLLKRSGEVGRLINGTIRALRRVRPQPAATGSARRRPATSD